jgi:hypothetical protein
MSSSNIILSSVENIAPERNKLTLRFPTNYVAKNDTIGLVSLSMYYSFFNLTATFNNLACSYTWTDGVVYPVLFPAGFYSVDDLSGFIQFVMHSNDHYLLDENSNPVYFFKMEINLIYYTVTATFTPVPSTLPFGWTNPKNITLSGTSPQLNTLNNSWGRLIGFPASSVYPPTRVPVSTRINSTVTPEINPVTSINVSCSWINDTRFSRFSSIIASFVPSGNFGGLISYSPPVLSSYAVPDNSYREITITFLDQNNNALQLQDNKQIQVTLSLKSKV